MASRSGGTKTPKHECELRGNPEKRVSADAQADSIRGAMPAGLSRPALRAISGAGVKRLKDFERFTEVEVAGWHGMGPKAMVLLREAMAAEGKSFRS